MTTAIMLIITQKGTENSTVSVSTSTIRPARLMGVPGMPGTIAPIKPMSISTNATIINVISIVWF